MAPSGSSTARAPKVLLREMNDSSRFYPKYSRHEPLGGHRVTFSFGHHARPRPRQRAQRRPTPRLRQRQVIYIIATPSHVPRTMRNLCFSHGTPYGHEHGWDTVATRCGRPTSSHTPKEHRTRPTMTWDDLPAIETIHSTAQPRHQGPDDAPKAQARTVRRAPQSTGKRWLHSRTQACGKRSRAAAARRASRASAPSRSDPQTPPSRMLQPDLAAAALQARRPARRGW